MQLKLFPLIFIVIYVPFDHLGKFSMIGLWWKFKMGKKYIISPKSWAIHVHRVHVTQTNDSLPLVSELNEENFLPCSEKVRICVSVIMIFKKEAVSPVDDLQRGPNPK